MIPWFSKLREILMLHFAASPSPLRGKPTQAQDVAWRTAKRDSTGYCSSPPSTSSSLHGLPSTSSSLHGLLFIQPPPRATPPATVQPPLHGHPSTVYCSSSPPHHGVLFNHPSTCTPPPSTVHPTLHHTTGSCSSRGNATAHCSSTPPPPRAQRSLFIQSIGFS